MRGLKQKGTGPEGRLSASVLPPSLFHLYFSLSVYVTSFCLCFSLVSAFTACAQWQGNRGQHWLTCLANYLTVGIKGGLAGVSWVLP